MPRVLICVVFGWMVSLLHARGWPLSLPILGTVVPSIVLGLLLVFRTNTAYERFWEGRKQWGALVNVVRNLARTVWVTVDESDPEDRAGKMAAVKLLPAFAIATKVHLRHESPEDSELAALLTPAQYQKLQTMNSPPLEIAFWVGDYLQSQYERKCIDAFQLTSLFERLDVMVDVLGACERILKTPIPLAYSIHLKQMISLYCLMLPFQIVAPLQGWTAPVTGLISFAILGIEAIGIEIENPFGRDPNDLPLDDICRTMVRNIDDLITLTPCTHHDGGLVPGEISRVTS